MKLRKLQIAKYKSIKESQLIEFDDDARPITLIGLNGSGKSNLLEAIYHFFNADTRNNNVYGGQKVEAEYVAMFELSEDEIDSLESVIAHDKEDKFLKVEFSYGKPTARTITYKPVSISIEKERARMLELLELFKQAAQEYIIAVKRTERKLVSGRSNGKDYTELETKPVFQSSDFSSDNVERRMNEEIARVNEYCSKFLVNGVINWDGYQYPHQSPHFAGWVDDLHRYDFSIRFTSKELSPLEKKHININALQKDIGELNKRIKEHSERLTEIVREFVECYKSIVSKITTQDDIYWERRDTEEKEYKSFLGRIHDALYQKCYFLDNERSLMFGVRGPYEQRSYENQFLNLRNPIENAFYNYCLEHKLLDSDVIKKGLNGITDDEREDYRAKFEKFVNDSRPAHDKNQYKKLAIDLAEGGKGFTLSIIENSGEKVDINATSLGRRWFFTYWFIKNSMKDGDYFLLDEPAAFLHPQAQKELLGDIEQLTLANRNLIIATHSPYMISERINSYYSVSIADKGSIIAKNSIVDFKGARDELGILDFNNVILSGMKLDTDKTYLFVEGQDDEAWLRKFIDWFAVNKSKYELVNIDGATHAEHYFNVAKVMRLDYMILLDSDQKQASNMTYKLQKLNSSNAKVFFVGEDTQEKALEGLFFGKDKRLLTQSKATAKNASRIASPSQLEKQTVDAFKSLLSKIGVAIE
ncbi:hypothetical protein FACS1894211_06560 [Clostridia bacterium]|nr:hypothetical protein FACS1894211_06560 [Clostridia bacterium]